MPLPENRRGLRRAQLACFVPTNLLPPRFALRREVLPQRLAFRSSDSAKPLEKFLGRDCLSPFRLSDRFRELRLKFRWNFKGLVRIASKDRDDRTFWKRIPFHDDLSVYDCSGGELHSGIIYPRFEPCINDVQRSQPGALRGGAFSAGRKASLCAAVLGVIFSLPWNGCLNIRKDFKPAVDVLLDVCRHGLLGFPPQSGQASAGRFPRRHEMQKRNRAIQVARESCVNRTGA